MLNMPISLVVCHVNCFRMKSSVTFWIEVICLVSVFYVAAGRVIDVDRKLLQWHSLYLAQFSFLALF